MKFRVTPLSGLYSKILIMFYVAAIPEKGAELRLPLLFPDLRLEGLYRRRSGYVSHLEYIVDWKHRS